MTRTTAFLLIALVVLLAGLAAPKGAPDDSLNDGRVAPAAAPALPGASLAPAPSLPAVAVLPASSDVSVLASPPPAAIYNASATWCAPTPTQCQSWGGDAKLGAVFGFRFGDEPYLARVWHGQDYVDVLILSHCACRGTHNAIDLSPSAFRVLAPLSRGRIDVLVEVPVGPGVTLPPTSVR